MAKIAINIATGSLQQKEMIVGIDLGTTNSLVAIIHPETKKPVALKEHDSASLVPSVVHFSEKEFLERHYFHTLIMLDRITMKPLKYSEPFYFNNRPGIEFCIGFTIVDLTYQFLI